MSTEPLGRPLQRVLLVLDLLKAMQSKYPNKDIFDLSPSDFAQWNPLLEDSRNLSPAFAKITDDTGGKITIAFDPVPIFPVSPGMYDGNHAIVGSFTPSITASIENPNDVANYKADLERQILSKKEEVSFVLSQRGNEAFLRLKGDDTKECRFKVSPKRFKILKHIIDAQAPVPTKELMTMSGLSAKDLRDELGEIRKRITKDLGVPGEQLLPNEPDRGYSFLNIEVEK